MKKTICVLLVLVMILALGISAMAENGKAAATSDASEATTEPPISGTDDAEEPEWDMSVPTEITEEIRANFDKAMEKLVGVNYVPVALAESQVVAGMNYCILCEISPVVPNPVPHFALVYVYADLEGNAEITSLKDFDITKYTEGDGKRKGNDAHDDTCHEVGHQFFPVIGFQTLNELGLKR